MVSCILLAGGKGQRMKEKVPKQFLTIAGKPMIMNVLETIDKIDKVSEIVIVCDDIYRDLISKWCFEFGIEKKIAFAKKGNTRQESSYNGLLVAANEIVVIHEAARPFVNVEDFEKLINNEDENITYGLPIPFTVLKCKNDTITDLLDRSELLNIQLPQKFNKTTLLEAHTKALNKKEEFTEDCSMIKYYDLATIKVLNGKDYNIKITNQTDLIVGEEIYREYFKGVKK